jgi:hypothetical protein
MIIWILHFQGTFAKLRKANISFVMSVRQFVWPSALNIMAPNGRNFMKSETWGFWKLYREISSLIKTLPQWRVISTKSCVYFWQYFAEFFVEWYMFPTKVVEKIKTNFRFIAFISENRAVYELTWKNLVSQTGHRRQYNMAHALCTLEESHSHAQDV